MPLSRQEMEAHVRAQGALSWIPASALGGECSEACVDGRAGAGVIAAPGGNAGELLALVGALEKAAGVRLDPADMDAILSRYLARFGRFCMHGDIRALATLPAHLLAPAETDDDRGAGDLARRIAEAPADGQDALLEALCRPESVGCGHLKAMLTDPESYGVRAELTEALLRSFFRALWRGADVEYTVLAGAHREAAVALVTVDGDVSAETLFPRIAPRVGDVQVFVAHPQAASLLRAWEARAIFEVAEVSTDIPTLEAELARLADLQQSVTLSRLAPGLPVYEVRFERSGEGAFEVIDRGHVPAA